MKVLVADDEEQLISLYTLALKKDGYSVIAARDGIETISKFLQENPDLVVLDYNMPRADGLEVASKILTLNPSVRIVMLTADYRVLKEAKRIGIDLFLVKPISIKLLLESLHKLSEMSPFSLNEQVTPDGQMIPIRCN